MNTNLTDLTVIMDRSGSMAFCQADAEGGLNTFIKKQAEEEGLCEFTLVQFDTEYEVVHNAVDIKMINKVALHPRGGTALLDAVGKAINSTGERLRNMNEHERPGLVVFVIVTDGHENSSTEFTKPQIKEMIEHQQEKYKWQFVFLGANQDAFAEGGAMGIAAQTIANYSTRKFHDTYSVTSDVIGRARSVTRTSGVTASVSYTDNERSSMTE